MTIPGTNCLQQDCLETDSENGMLHAEDFLRNGLGIHTCQGEKKVVLERSRTFFMRGYK